MKECILNLKQYLYPNDTPKIVALKLILPFQFGVILVAYILCLTVNNDPSDILNIIMITSFFILGMFIIFVDKISVNKVNSQIIKRFSYLEVVLVLSAILLLVFFQHELQIVLQYTLPSLFNLM